MVTFLVLCLAALFGYVAADRWLSVEPSGPARDQAGLFLCTVSAFVALTVHVTFA